MSQAMVEFVPLFRAGQIVERSIGRYGADEADEQAQTVMSCLVASFWCACDEDASG